MNQTSQTNHCCEPCTLEKVSIGTTSSLETPRRRCAKVQWNKTSQNKHGYKQRTPGGNTHWYSTYCGNPREAVSLSSMKKNSQKQPILRTAHTRKKTGWSRILFRFLDLSPYHERAGSPKTIGGDPVSYKCDGQSIKSFRIKPNPTN